jgi:hypothetical protein
VSGRTGLAGTGDIYRKGAPQEITVVELLAGAFRAGLIGHGDESESAGSAGHFIGDDPTATKAEEREKARDARLDRYL